MPVTFTILPRHGLVYVRFEGIAYPDESAQSMRDYLQHPDYHPDQKQLIDLSRLTAIVRDYPRLIALMADIADILPYARGRLMAVYYAPTAAGREMVRVVRRSWEGVPGVVLLVAEHEAEALSVLGLRETSFAELLADAG